VTNQPHSHHHGCCSHSLDEQERLKFVEHVLRAFFEEEKRNIQVVDEDGSRIVLSVDGVEARIDLQTLVRDCLSINY
jgi:hypothetical protein